MRYHQESKVQGSTKGGGLSTFERLWSLWRAPQRAQLVGQLRVGLRVTITFIIIIIIIIIIKVAMFSCQLAWLVL